ncbi:hypothetical protein M8C21_021848, partial [Ambrosia artemisiifolia]
MKKGTWTSFMERLWVNWSTKIRRVSVDGARAMMVVGGGQSVAPAAAALGFCPNQSGCVADWMAWERHLQRTELTLKRTDNENATRVELYMRVKTVLFKEIIRTLRADAFLGE